MDDLHFLSLLSLLLMVHSWLCMCSQSNAQKLMCTCTWLCGPRKEEWREREREREGERERGREEGG